MPMDVGALVKRADYVRIRNSLDFDRRANHFLNYNAWLRSAVHHMQYIGTAIRTKPEEKKFLERHVDAVFACIFNAIMHGEYGTDEKRALIDTSKINRVPIITLLTDRRLIHVLGEYTRKHDELNGVLETATIDGVVFYGNYDLGSQLRQMVGFVCTGINTEMTYMTDYRKFTRALNIENIVFQTPKLPYKKM